MEQENGMLEEWKNGRMEYWAARTGKNLFSLFHHSTIPFFHRSI